MSELVATYPVGAFTDPTNGNAPVDADEVKANDNALRTGFNSHDADPGIHLQGSTLATRPAAGSAGRKWFSSDTNQIFRDTGAAWEEIDYLNKTNGGTVAGNTTFTGTLTSTAGSRSFGASTFTGAITGTSAIFSSTISAAGATLTGALAGTSATFSGTLGVTGASTFSSVSATTGVFSSTIAAVTSVTITGINPAVNLFGTNSSPQIVWGNGAAAVHWRMYETTSALGAAGNLRIVDAGNNDVVSIDVATNGFKVVNAFGCNDAAPQGKYTLGAAATDLASVITLANNLRTMAINNGMGQL